MKQIWKKIRKNTMLVLLMLGLCGIGIRIALTNAVPYSPDALPTVAQSNSKDLIFVLDAGHGEST